MTQVCPEKETKSIFYIT